MLCLNNLSVDGDGMGSYKVQNEIEKLYGAVLMNDEAVYPLCDFQKLCSAVIMKDEILAKDWYENEYGHSCFAVSAVDQLRRRKNGFIVLIGYMRSTVMSVKRSPSLIMLENMYIRLVENCTDEESVNRLFLTAFRDFCNNLNEENGTKKVDEITLCTQYIVTNLKTSITLSDVALHCGYNPSYLSRKFKQVHGVSVKQFILRERLRAAAAALRHSDKSIAEIASFFKFSSQSHFQQEFKKNYGITPLQYRKKSKMQE